ncbi:MAG: phosphoglucosamine mutase [Ilumatobacteraceae bacterium]|nr:phosphoglucosamine mutase [Ilumatobacteraceae bacterium]
MLHFGTDGVRGVALDELTTELVHDLGRAIAHVLQPTAIVVGRDTRQSGPTIEAALIQGITAEGVPVHMLGVAPTPAVAFISERHDWVGVVVTASHNPWQDNGIKVFAAGGTKLTDAQQIEVEREWHALSSADIGVSKATVHDASDLLQEYIDHRVSIVGADRLQGMAIVLDCANGAMSSVAPAVFRAVGADVVVINDSPNGTNINAECGAASPSGLSAAVNAALQVDVGIAFDGDGDRLIAVDDRATIVDGDRLIALAATDLADRGLLRNRAVAVTVMTNMGFHRAMETNEIDVVITAVGDRNILLALEEQDLVLGGEQSGHIIHRAHATTGDGLLAALLLAEFLHRTQRPLSQHADDIMVSYPQVLINIKTTEQVFAPADQFAREIADAQHVLGKDGRVLVRSSGTEPLVRIMVEASTTEIARQVATELATAVVRVCGGDIQVGSL